MLIVLTGPASAGKDTILLKLLEIYPNLKRVITTTTRPKRVGETEGKDYHFVTKEKFRQMLKDGEFVEFVDFSDNFYGTTKKELEPLLRGENLIWRVETSRAAKVKEVLPPHLQEKTIVIYIDVPDWEVLKNRMRKRGMSEEEISQRLRQDAQDFRTYRKFFNHIIFNKEGKINSAISQVKRIIDGIKN